MPAANGLAERAVKSERLDLLNHIRGRDVDELQWYLGEYKNIIIISARFRRQTATPLLSVAKPRRPRR
jgi:hypothetical protein